MLLFLSIVILVISVILIVLAYNKQKDIKEYNTHIDKQNQKIKEENQTLKNERDKLTQEIEFKQKEIDSQKQYQQQSDEMLKRASEQYAEMLDWNYSEKEKEYDNLIAELRNNYGNVQDKLIAETAQIKNDLDKISATRAAAIQAQVKEKEIKEELSFYCLTPSQNDVDDIHALERVKPNLHQPRILCMLIWSTYFQKPMTALCNNILGTAIVAGIYKITNQKTGECYIGQSVDIAKRWKDHAKCGLGIDTPANNKLYQAIQEYGIWNFSWELLEQCSKEELDEKEAFYINLYQAKEYGYNSIKGNKKS